MDVTEVTVGWDLRQVVGRSLHLRGGADGDGRQSHLRTSTGGYRRDDHGDEPGGEPW